MSAGGNHRSTGPTIWPWTRDRRDSGLAGIGADDRTAGGAPGAAASPGARSWPIDASPADVAAARQWLADYPERFPASLPPPPYPHPAIGPLLELLIAGHNAAAVLDAALRHQEAFQ